MSFSKNKRKADARLAEAREYVSKYKKYMKITSKPEPYKKVLEPVKVVPVKGKKVESFEIKKLQKGYFFLVLTIEGKKVELQKRFKSTTKASEWARLHPYYEV